MMKSVIAAALMVAGASAATLSMGNLAGSAMLGWRAVNTADDAHMVSVRITLPRTNMDYLATTVAKVSDPTSPDYTNYPSMAEITAMTAPAQASVDAVTMWLTATGNTFTVSPSGDFLVTMSAKSASTLFQTTFRTLHNELTGQTSVVGDAVNVPDEMSAHIEAVFGVHGLPLPPRKTQFAPDSADVTPAVIETAYKTSGAPTPAGTDANRQAIVEFQGQLLSQKDLTTFFNKFVPKAKAGDDKVYKYVGDQQQGEGVEANLDIQYIMGVAPGIKTEAWQYAGQDFCADLKQWTQQIIGTTNPPNVFSVSYGWQGELTQIGCSTSQVASIDDDFKTIAASGVSIIFASGDSGSGYTSTFGSDPKLYSSWPASSQYVTAVGATRFINQTPGSGEQASDQFGSGGGFSRVVTPAPSFQADAIKTFYGEETKLPPQKIYGFGGRGTPDVAALGEGFQVVIGGGVESVGGTSAAAPTFAAIVSLLNEARIQAGKKPLGLLNSMLYQNADKFNDVTVGSDRVSRSGLPVPDGFDCVKGWDPVTGWGTPDYPKLSSL